MAHLSIKPYLIRAIHEWCSDHGYTPYLVVAVNEHMQVPLEYVKNGEIVLNIAYNATRNLQLGNDYIRFAARFSGVSRDVIVPIGAVVSLFSRENGEGMAWEVDNSVQQQDASVHPTSLKQIEGFSVEGDPPPDTPAPSSPQKGRAKLRVVK